MKRTWLPMWVALLAIVSAAGASAAPVLPDPPPFVPEAAQRAAALEGLDAHRLGPGRMTLDALDEEFSLDLSETQREEMGKLLETDLYPLLDWTVTDFSAFLLRVNEVLGLGIDDKALVDYGVRLHEMVHAMPRESIPGELRVEHSWTYDDSLANTSWDLTGSTLVLVVLVRPPGVDAWDNSFPTYDISTALGNAGDGMKFYKDKAPDGANVSYEVRYYNVSSSADPVNNDDCVEAWKENIFVGLGYTDTDGDGAVFDDVARYLRTLYSKDNCVIMFVPKEAGRAYACRGGWAGHYPPECVVYYYDTWIIRNDYNVYAHELGHLFGACDEYYQFWDNTGCATDDPDNQMGEACDDPCYTVNPAFRPWCKNENCLKCNILAENCIMMFNSLRICDHTWKQFGWSDHDGDGFIDGTDANPSTWGPSCNNGAPEITPPASQVLSMADRQTSSTTVTAYWAGTDVCGGLSSYDIQFKDGAGAWTDWKSAVTSTNSAFTGSDFHTYYFRARARDSYGNLEAWPVAHDARTTFMVGTPPTPVIASPTHPSESTWYGSNDPQFSWSVPVGSDLPLYDLIPSFSWDITRGATDNPDDAYDGSGTTTSMTNLADGIWYFHVKGKDWTGTWSATAHRCIRIDTTSPAAPVITSDTHPTSTVWYNNGTLSVQWTPPADSSGIAGYSLAGPDHDPYTTPGASANEPSNSKYFYDLATGTWYVHVRAVDNLGHWGPAGHFKVQVDRTPPPPPVVTSATHAQSAAWYANNDPSFAWTDPADDSGIGGYSYLQNTSPHTLPDTTSEGINPATFYDNVGDGQRYFHIIARDNAVPPNWSSSVTHYGYKVDTTTPGAVTGIASASHSGAIGQWNNPQSSGNTVEAHWTAAVDPSPGSGVGGYSIVWDHAAGTLPDQSAELAGTATSVVSPALPDGTDLWFHIRSRDAVGNWDDAAVHLGPFFINTVPPSVPSGFWVTPGNARNDVDWWDNVDPDFAGFNIYRGTAPGGPYTKLNTTPLFASSYADLAVWNGTEYFYTVTATDSVGNESGRSVERSGMPEYATPGTGIAYTLVQLVAISNHGITGASPSFTMNGTVTISAGDTLVVAGGQTLLSSDRKGVRKLDIQGVLIADGGGGAGGWIRFAGSDYGRNQWGGISIPAGGAGGVLDSCIVEHAAAGIDWTGPAVVITHCEVRQCAGTGISARTIPNGVCAVQENNVHDNSGNGIFVGGNANAVLTVLDNTVTGNGDDGIEYLVLGPAAPAAFSIAGNTVRNNNGDGITCGQGSGPIFIQGNDVRGNRNGIIMDGENWGARPTIRFNNIQGNHVAGVHCANQATPLLDTNTIVGNVVHGLYAKTLAEPLLVNNTITGSQYGVYITQYAAAPVPDLGSAANQTGMNKIHGNSLFSVYNNTSFGVRAQGNWWGAAATLQMAMNPPPPALGPVAEIWDVFDNAALGMVDYANWLNLGDTPPTITITAPAAPVTVDTAFVVTWTDSDPEEDALVNLYFDVDASGLDGTPIAGGAGLSEDDLADSLAWDTSKVTPGTYYVYGVIDDGFTTASSYSGAALTIDHAQIGVAPDTLALDLSANVIHDETVTVRNLSANYPLHYEGAVEDTTGTAVAWAALLPDTGTVAAGDSAEVILRMDTGGFAAGTYLAQARFASDDPLDSLVVAPVVGLTVAFPVTGLSDTTLGFGSVEVGSYDDRSVTVYNTGTGGGRLGYIVITNDDFSCVGASFPDTVAPGDSASYTIRFSASEYGPRSGTLTFVTDDPYDSTLAVSLSGTGLASDIALSDTTYAFGIRARADSTTWAFRFWNDGNDTLVVASAGSDHADYLAILPVFADTLAPGDTATVTVRYRALTEGETEATLTLASNDPDEGSRTVHLTGEVEKPDVAVAPSSHAFGTVRVDAGIPWSFKIHSAGSGALAVHEITRENPDYAWSGVDLPDTLASGDSLTVSVTFTPFASGASNDTMWVHTDDAETPYVAIVVTGAGGTPALAAADSLHDFGEVLTTASADWSLKLTNAGTVSVQVDSVTVSGEGYQAVETFPILIAAGDSAFVTVRFAPPAPDSLAATLTVHSDDLTRPELWLMLAGQGVEPDLALSAPSHDFGEVLLGGHADWTLRIHNVGSHELDVSQCAPDSAEFSVVSPAFPQTVAPGDSLEVLVRFAPAGEELAVGGLHLETDDPVDSTRVVGVVGTGVWPNLFRAPTAIAAVTFEEDDSTTPLQIRNVGTGSLGFLLSEDDSVFAGYVKALESMEAKFGAYEPGGDDGTPEKASDDIAWLSVAPAADTLGTGEARNVQVACDATGRPHGIYKASLTLASNDPDTALVYVPVKMRVPRMRFADHHTDSIVFTVADEGCYGFFDLGQYFAYGEGAYGSGFAYQGLASALSHGAFWVGRDSLHVVDGSYDYDWAATPDGHIAVENRGAEYGRARFTDASAPAPVGVEVTQLSVAFPHAPHEDFVTLQYTVKNRTGAALSGVFTGLYMDWDILDVWNDAGAYSAVEALGYTYDARMPDSTYYGICMVVPSAPHSFHLVHNPTYVHPTGNISDLNKWHFLSDGVKDAATWQNTDWSMLMSTGPHTIAAGDSITVIYAVVAGRNLADLKANAVAARTWGQIGVEPDQPPEAGPAIVGMVPPYPNPFTATTTFELRLPRRMEVRLQIFDLKGRLVRTLAEGPLDEGLTRIAWDGRDEFRRHLATGIYFCRLAAGETVIARKLLLMR